MRLYIWFRLVKGISFTSAICQECNLLASEFYFILKNFSLLQRTNSRAAYRTCAFVFEPAEASLFNVCAVPCAAC